MVGFVKNLTLLLNTHCNIWKGNTRTLIAVYGLFIIPIGWEFALYSWLYAFVWFLINDVIKMMTYRVFNN
jgi:hypothetical protein